MDPVDNVFESFGHIFDEFKKKVHAKLEAVEAESDKDRKHLTELYEEAKSQGNFNQMKRLTRIMTEKSNESSKKVEAIEAKAKQQESLLCRLRMDVVHIILND